MGDQIGYCDEGCGECGSIEPMRAEIERLTAESERLRAAVEDAIDTLEAMDLHIDNPLYERLCAVHQQQTMNSEEGK